MKQDGLHNPIRNEDIAFAFGKPLYDNDEYI